ncbi:MAG: phage tail family protein [Candidatus Hydrogenedentes bacterium]|nr:phage tail family protein [Candidatus Hydrogenedentota bacterium]
MGHSLYLGGPADDPLGSDVVYLGDDDYGITLNMDEADLLASIDANVQDVPYGFGGVSWGHHYPGRVIPVKCWMLGESWTEVRAKLDRLNLLLTRNGLMSLRFDDVDDRFWMVRAQRPGRVTPARNGAVFELSFVAPDPRAYSTTETVQTINLTAGVTNATVPASGVVGGSAEADPVWVLKPTGAGAAAPSVENTSRSELAGVNTTIVSTRWVRFDATRRGILEYSDDSGVTWASFMSVLSPASIFPRLSPGVSNAIEITGLTGTGTLVVTYRERYH